MKNIVNNVGTWGKQHDSYSLADSLSLKVQVIWYIFVSSDIYILGWLQWTGNDDSVGFMAQSMKFKK